MVVVIDLACPENAGGSHVWAGVDEARGGDPRNSCRHCGRPGRDGKDEQGGFLGEATAARAELFSRLEQPKSVKVWGKQS